MKIGYIRVVMRSKNTARQEVQAARARLTIFIDKRQRKNADRPELTSHDELTSGGDTVIVESISRFARNTRPCFDLVESG